MKLQILKSRLQTIKSKVAVMQPGSGPKRMAGRKLQERRLRVWSKTPCCVMCGRLTAYPHGFELDHIKSLDHGGPDTEDNCQVLCVERDEHGNKTGCHVKKTAKDMGYRVRKTISEDGWPE